MIRALVLLTSLLLASASLADTSSVDRVTHAGGSFVHQGGTTWNEVNAAGQVGFTFQETGRDATTIHLFDASRGIYIDLDTASGFVRYKGSPEAAFGNLYAITEVGTRAAPPAVAPSPGAPPTAGGVPQVTVANQLGEAIELYRYVDETHESLGEDLPSQGSRVLTIAPGTQVHFFKAGQDDLHGCYDVTSAGAQTLTVTAAGPDCFAVAAEEPAASPEETAQRVFQEQLFRRPEYLQWLTTNQPTRRFTKEPSAEDAAESLRGLDTATQGYHLLRMNPNQPSDNGVLAKDVFVLDGGLEPGLHHKDERNAFALPLWLDLRRGTPTRGDRIALVSFNEQQRREFQSMSVTVGAGGPKGKGSAGITNSTERTDMEKEGRTSIFQQRYAHWGTAVVDKRYLRLHAQFIKAVREESFQTRKDFERFFDDFGTHYALRLMLGGKVMVETMIESAELASGIAQSVTRTASAEIPIKAATVTASTKFEEKREESLRKRSSTDSTRFLSFGGQPGSSPDSWQLDTYDTGTMEPIRVMLEPISDLIRPQLFGSKDAADAAKIDALRTRMRKELDAYMEREVAANPPVPEMEPFAYRIKINHVKLVTQDDNEIILGGNNEPDVYGKIATLRMDRAPLRPEVAPNYILIANGVPSETGEVLDTSFEKAAAAAYDMRQGEKIRLMPDSSEVVFVPKARPGRDGRLRGTIERNHLAVIAMLHDKDHTGDGHLPAAVVHYEVPAQMPFAARRPVTPPAKRFGTPGAGTYEMSVTFEPVALTFEQDDRLPLPDWVDDGGVVGKPQRPPRTPVEPVFPWTLGAGGEGGEGGARPRPNSAAARR